MRARTERRALSAAKLSCDRSFSSLAGDYPEHGLDLWDLRRHPRQDSECSRAPFGLNALGTEMLIEVDVRILTV